MYLALGAMKMGGHRYGAFLDAATTAAKFAIYSTYIEQGKNIRKTGFLYHVEPKRVKAIIKEVQDALNQGQTLKTLNSQEPYYLIALPHLWQEKFPCRPGQPRVMLHGLTPSERLELEQSLPADLPNAKLLDPGEFTDLIQLLHELSQAELPSGQRMTSSDALTEHIKFRLLHSGTVLQVDSPLLALPLFALARTTYIPRGERERVFTMIDDVARFFSLLQSWVNEEPGVLRAIEVFDVDPARQEEALSELDQMLQAWADKYHQDGGHPMVLQVAAGAREYE
jgi:Peptidase family S48/Heterocyst differentiation regulator C-terminal Hood domain